MLAAASALLTSVVPNCSDLCMAKHEIDLEVPQVVAVMHKDVTLRVWEDEELLGTLRISKGSIDWRPRKAHYVRRMSWSKFDRTMEQRGSLKKIG